MSPLYLVTSYETLSYLSFQINSSISGEDSLATPLMVRFTVSSRANSSSGTCKAGKDPPLTLFSWDLLMYPEGCVRSLELNTDTAAIKQNLRIIHQVIAPEGSKYSRKANERTSYRLLYHKPTPSTSLLVFQSPFQTMEGEARYTPPELILKLHPNRNESETKYEITVTKRILINGTKRNIIFEGRVHHPRLSKELLLGIECAAEGQALQGRAELDIFPDATDKIVANFNSTGISENSFKAIVHLTSRVSCLSLMLYTCYNDICSNPLCLLTLEERLTPLLKSISC